MPPRVGPAPLLPRSRTPVLRTRPEAAPSPDPSTFRPEQPRLTTYPTFDAHDAGIATPRLVNTDGSLRSPTEWRTELSSDPQTAIRQVAAALWHGDGAPYSYQAYGTDLSQARPSINDGLARGGGECDWFAAVGYHALAPVLGSDNVKAVQVFANGGWHNVVTFRNPDTGLWDIMDYNNVVSVGAATPGAAVRGYFGNIELGVLYETNDPNAKASIAYRLRSDHQATLTGALSQPGLAGAMSPTYGATRGLNERPARPGGDDAQLGGSTSGARVAVGDVTVDVRATPDGFVRGGVSFLTPTGADTQAGAKATVVRDSSGRGVNVFVAGEWWHIDDDSYFGVVAGAELRVGAGTDMMSGRELTTLAPALALQGGHRFSLVGDRDTPHQLSWFWNGRLQLAAPFVLNEDERADVGSGSNGNTSVLDPGFLGLAELGVNTGLAARFQLGERLRLDTTGVVRVIGQDPTLSGWPVGIGAQLDARMTYADGPWTASVGATAGIGLYDRDILWSVYANGDYAVSPDLSVGLNGSGGQFTSREAFGQAMFGVRGNVGDNTRLRGGAGVVITGAPDGPTQVVPSIGITIER